VGRDGEMGYAGAKQKDGVTAIAEVGAASLSSTSSIHQTAPRNRGMSSRSEPTLTLLCRRDIERFYRKLSVGR
jgi:hypothetical protein